MPDTWRKITVGDTASKQRNALVGGPFGSNLVSADYVESGVPVIRGQNMGQRWLGGEFAYVSAAKAQSLQANWARPGDLVFTQRGTLGQVSIVPDGAFEKYVVSQSQMKLTVDPSTADALFVYYVFSNRQQIEYLRTNAIQTGVPHINLGILRNAPLLLPPLPTQRAIAGILGSLDDKIELNRRMSETLEAMASAIFKDWFVDFGPTRAKVKGRSTATLSGELRRNFPDTLMNSEVGEIPAGWHIKGLDEVARFLNGLALQKFPPENGSSLPVIKIAQLRAGHTRDADQASGELEHAYIVNDGDVLFSWSGSLECVLWTGGRGALNQHLFKVTSEQFPKWFYYLWIHEHLNDFRRIAASKATTMGHIQRHHLAQAKVVVPPPQALSNLGPALASIIDAIIARRLENRTLEHLRDTLLPKLISGEVRVSSGDLASSERGR